MNRSSEVADEYDMYFFSNTSLMTLNHDLRFSVKVSSVICGVLMFLFGFVGIISNITSIVIFSRKEMRSSVSVLLTALCCVDIVVILLGCLVYGIQSLTAGVVNCTSLEIFIAYSTVNLYPYTLIAQTFSIWLITITTAERFVAVVFPLDARKICTVYRAKLIIFYVFVFSILFNVPRFWEMQVYQEASTRALKVSDNLRSDSVYFVVYVVCLYLLVLFIVPFLSMLVLNCCIIYYIRKPQLLRVHLSRKQCAEQRIAVMLIFMVLVFIACQSLPFLLNIFEAYQRDWFTNPHTLDLAYLLLDVSNTLVIFNCSASAIFYYIFSQRYRCILKALLCYTNTHFYGVYGAI